MGNNLLTGDRLRLRALEPEDVDLLFEWENDPSVWSVSNTLAPFARFQIEDYIMNTPNEPFKSLQLRLMIDLREPWKDQKTIGTIDLFDIDPLHHRAGLGILIREPFRQQGYGLEAMNILLAYVFGTLHLHQLYCNISPHNASSLKLFEKSGFVLCGTKKDWLFDGEKWQDELMFQLIRAHV